MSVTYVMISNFSRVENFVVKGENADKILICTIRKNTYIVSQCQTLLVN